MRALPVPCGVDAYDFVRKGRVRPRQQAFENVSRIEQDLSATV